MTLEQIYYVGQTIAVVAILGSLGAIWVQLRKDHALARANSHQTLFALTSKSVDALADYPTALESVQQCLIDHSGAPSRSKVEFAKYIHQQIAIAEMVVYLRQERLISSIPYEKLLAYPALILSTPGGQTFWESGQLVYGADVVAALNEYMRDHPSDLDTLYAAVPFFIPDEPTVLQTIADNREEPSA